MNGVSHVGRDFTPIAPAPLCGIWPWLPCRTPRGTSYPQPALSAGRRIFLVIGKLSFWNTNTQGCIVFCKQFTFQFLILWFHAKKIHRSLHVFAVCWLKTTSIPSSLIVKISLAIFTPERSCDISVPRRISSAKCVEKNVRRHVKKCQKICQKICQRECQKICQKEFQKI